MTPLPKISLLAILSTLLPLISAQGTQFITGACTSDAICASACCGFNSGKCAGPIVAQERDGGCGFGDAVPNDRAAQLLRGGGNSPAPTQRPSGLTTVRISPTPTGAIAQPGNGNGNGNGAENGNATTPNPGQGSVAPGTQFITGTCTADADCASACCGFRSGKCAGPIVAQERDGGCGFGNAVPNDDAARALRGQQRRRWVLSLLGL